MRLRRHSKGNRNWLVDLRSLGGGRVTIPDSAHLSRKEVWPQATRIEREFAERRRHERRPPTLHQALERYWAEEGHRLRSAPTVDSQLGAIEDATEPNLLLQDVDGALCLRLRLQWSRELHRPPGGKRARPLSPGAINRRLSRLRRVLAFARDHWGIDTKRVVWRDILLPEAEPKDRALTREQVRRLWRASAPHLRRYISLAMLTGLRSGPLLRLSREHVDLKARRIIITGKGRGPEGKANIVPLDDLAYRYLRLIVRGAKGGKPLITYGGEAVDSIKVAWAAALRRAGLPRTITPHMLRHTFLQALYDATGDLALVQAAAHHADIRTTARYARAREERVRAGLARMRRGPKR